jgi:hypothetical protein
MRLRIFNWLLRHEKKFPRSLHRFILRFFVRSLTKDGHDCLEMSVMLSLEERKGRIMLLSGLYPDGSPIRDLSYSEKIFRPQRAGCIEFPRDCNNSSERVYVFPRPDVE